MAVSALRPPQTRNGRQFWWGRSVGSVENPKLRPRLRQRRSATAEGDHPAWQAAFGRKPGIPPARSVDGRDSRTPEVPEWIVGSPHLEVPDPAAAKGWRP